MPDSAALIGFTAAAFVLFAVPGPAVLYIVTRSMAQGRRAGLVSVAGIHAGSLVHVAAAVAGLTTLLATSATAFRVVKWAGAGYLVYLGVRAWLGTDEAAGGDEAVPRSMRKVFAQGFVVTLLNPKVAVFFLAFVPQFVDPAAGSATQVLVLGAVFVGLGLVMDGLYALAAGTAGDRLQRAGWWRAGRRWVSGSIYLALGVAAALAGGRGD
ncbi:MAG: LysE family translocator [Actinobacteria bacterium]|nr:LysE family translocator [Actinomycetota bacterium]